MEKYGQHLCVGITCSSICSYLSLKAFEAINHYHLHSYYYIVYGLAVSGIFVSAYHIGWQLGFTQQQSKYRELQKKYTELEALTKQNPQSSNFIEIQSDSEDSEDYEDAKRLKNI